MIDIDDNDNDNINADTDTDTDTDTSTNTNARTIAAIATPIGRGGIGIIRLSGPKAYAIACHLTGKASFIPRLASFCRFYAQRIQSSPLVLDEGLVLYFKAPHSFTGEDVIELHGHGGVILQNQLLAHVLQLGADQAQPGEFSYRAFENDKLDLLQAEAIADAIDATSVAAANSAMRSLTGEFSARINRVLEALIEVRLYVEAAIDFPEEDDVDFLADGVILAKLETLQNSVTHILATAQQGQLLRDGVNVVLAGRPNAGKSSLLNILAGQQRAIVTEVAGTTRDTLQETLVLNGLTMQLTDTAGLRPTEDTIERMGIERAHQAIAQADLLLLVYDVSQDTNPLQLATELFATPIDSQAFVLHPQRLLLIGNKIDLISDPALDDSTLNTSTLSANTLNTDGFNPPMADTTTVMGYDQVNVSCVTAQGIDSLIAMLCEKVGFHPSENSLIARTRHLDALRRTLQHLQEARLQLVEYQAGELVAESLRQAQRSLGEITGVFSADDLLGRIFGSFCIGK